MTAPTATAGISHADRVIGVGRILSTLWGEYSASDQTGCSQMRKFSLGSFPSGHEFHTKNFTKKSRNSICALKYGPMLRVMPSQ
jgi:hypothetical protein